MRVHDLRVGQAVRYRSPLELLPDGIRPVCIMRRGRLQSWLEYVAEARWVATQHGPAVPVFA